MVSRFHGVDSEVGTLRTVIVHRPGAELTRVLPRDAGRLGFTHLPWAARAQQEHDVFTQVLRDHGVQVLYLTELLQDVLEYSPARRQAIDAALGAVTLGDELTGQVRSHLEDLDPEALTEALIAGLTAAEFGGGRGVVYQLLPGSDFVVEPLPNLVFVRDCSVWIGDGLRASHPQAFLVCAAQAAGLDRLRVIETGLGPAAPDREQWDDAGNLLGPGLVVSYERNVASHARLERCGVEVITVPGGELSGVRGGPRSLCCPVSRDPALLPGDLSRKLSGCAQRSCLESGRRAR
jgi:arginine deiminase